MGLDFEYTKGQTPIDEDEKEGLLIETISTTGELNEFEQLFIEETIQWLMGKSFKRAEILSEKFIKDLHKRMFGKVWAWAGLFRRSNKNIGVDKFEIHSQVKQLCDDANFWIENQVFSNDEMAVRFKHRLVSIHCFPNGNGRHSRLMADIIVEKVFKKEPFTWGLQNLVKPGESRLKYLKALREADVGYYSSLLKFSRS